ncbi:hypothetical protein PHLCEN_2v627 [Hermanssonia centrifuga]|uniref:Uncharacterized protein n=1 Tax=Hermanssonia centrifuga TaxID=98765 RepID=A0A2R6S5K7_9APHY|nr:hypothetical protein PHLCEN_2v627 [Hermanssonia centrifuga]
MSHDIERLVSSLHSIYMGKIMPTVLYIPLLLTCAIGGLAENVVVDDQGGKIVYSGNWTPLSLAFDGSGPVNDTLTGTGGPATATLEFTGTNFVVFGYTLPFPYTRSTNLYNLSVSFVIDSNEDSRGTHNEHDGPLTGVQFYTSPSLSSGNHTLLITSAGDSFYLDYVAVQGLDEQSSSSSLSSTPSRAISSTRAPPSGASPTSTSSGPSLVQTGFSNHASRQGKITGGVIGGIVGVVLLCLGLYLYRRRSRTLYALPDPFVSHPLQDSERGERSNFRDSTIFEVEDAPQLPLPTRLNANSRVSPPGKSAQGGGGFQTTSQVIPSSNQQNLHSVPNQDDSLMPIPETASGPSADPTLLHQQQLNEQYMQERSEETITEPASQHVRRHETDSGVRLAGGRPWENAEEDNDPSDMRSMYSTLPPPYSDI